MTEGGLAGLNWAVSGKTIASASVLVSGACAVLLLSPEQVGTFLLAINLLSLFAIADFGSAGYLTVRSAESAADAPSVRAIAQVTNAASVGLFAVAIWGVGTGLLKGQPAGSVVLTPGAWVYLVLGHAAWHTVAPLLAQLDGMGRHTRAWSLVFLFELTSGLGLTVPLLFGRAADALVLAATARLVMVPLVLVALPAPFRPWRSWWPHAFRSRAAWRLWAATALSIQASFLWVNLTGFAAIRTIMPLVYLYRGARESAAIGVSFTVATAIYNLCSSWSFGSMGRLAVAYAEGDGPRLFGILEVVRLRSATAFAVLLSATLATFHLIHVLGVPGLVDKVPGFSVFLPIGIGHFLMLGASWDAVAIRSTGKDLSAPAIGGIGLASVCVFWLTASSSRLEWLSWAFALINLVSTLTFRHYWGVRKAEMRVRPGHA